MKLIFIFLLYAHIFTEGSGLWCLSHVTEKEIYFNIEHDHNSVRVNAFFKDLLIKKQNTNPIRFFLFTRNFHKGVELKEKDNITSLVSEFSLKSGVKVLIHGFANSATSSFSTLIRNAYITKKKYIVIVVDWSILCGPPFYSSAVDNVKKVGVATADFLQRLMLGGLSASNIHILGHSVGAHIAGVVGRTIIARGQGRVARITGLDPAKPMFEHEADSHRLTWHDAVFVDCVHTCGGFLGLSDASCHADFYPNGGTSPQPGCQLDIFGICSHQRAYKYYAESISNTEAFKVVPCSVVEGYSPTNCSSLAQGVMGEHLDLRSRGIFYVATAPRPPYSLLESTASVGIFKRFTWYFF